MSLLSLSEIEPSPSLQFYFEGDDFFFALENAVKSATQSIDWEFYFFASDELGWHFAKLLIEKAREGVRVRVIVDAVGSRSTSIDLFDALEAAGISCKIYNPLFPYGKHIGRRNHRKMVLIDEKTGFLGGFNVSSEYSRKYSGEKAWRDTGVKLEQPELVRDLLGFFEEAWEKRKLSLRRLMTRLRRPALSPGSLHVVPNFGFRRKSFIRRKYLSAITGARRSIAISNPYFVPDHGILRALRKAARRKVQVRILTAGGDTDVHAARWAGQAVYSRLLKTGVRIFEYRGRMMHAKCAIVDESWFTIGTANIDHLSFFKNLEVNLFGKDGGAGGILLRQFEKDLLSSREILWKEWEQRPWTVKCREKFFSWFREWL
jgi:cardiolipin synthase